MACFTRNWRHIGTGSCLLRRALSDSKRVVLQFDGGARNNPGVAGCGALLLNDQGVVLWEGKAYLGEHTNNYAEYRGLILGLQQAVERNIENLLIQGDSQLVIKQMTGKYKVRSPGLLPLHKEASTLHRRLLNATFAYIPRAQNSRADALANAAMDSANVPTDSANVTEARVTGEADPSPSPAVEHIAYVLQFAAVNSKKSNASGCAALLLNDEGKELWWSYYPIPGYQTTGIADYHGLIHGLKKANGLGLKVLRVRGASQLIIKQMTGEFNVKSEALAPLFQEAKSLSALIGEVHFDHVPRVENTRPEDLAKSALETGEQFEKTSELSLER